MPMISRISRSSGIESVFLLGRMCGDAVPLLLFARRGTAEFGLSLQFRNSSRSAVISFCPPADPGSSFDPLAGAGADGRGAEKGIHGGRRLPADNPAAGRTEFKRWA